MKPENLLTALTDNIKVDPEMCIACGKCAEVCILDNLRMRQAPCAAACPLGVNCQGYVRLIARGEEDKARKVLFETCPLPIALAYLCPRPCEAHCHRRATSGEAVAIRELKRYLVDNAETGPTLPALAQDPGKKAAVFGAGPAGLAAAHDLASAGCLVTVFESKDHTFGRARRHFRKPGHLTEALDRETARLAERGVLFQYGTALGKDLGIDETLARYDVVIVATGKNFPVPGEVRDQPRALIAGEAAGVSPSMVENAASGRRAAASVVRLLSGGPEFLSEGTAPGITNFEIDTTRGEELERMQEIIGPISSSAARAEASRCYGCGGPVGYYRTCWFCLPCEVECPEQAIRVEVPYLLR